MPNISEKSIKALDSPIIHSGTPPLLKLYEHMQEYSKVAISGEGADEAFYGLQSLQRSQ